MSDTRSLVIGQFDDFLTDCLASGRNESRAGLAISLSEAQGDRSRRNWKASEQIVDDYCRRHALDLTLFPELTWPRVKRFGLSAIGCVAAFYFWGYTLRLVTPMVRMYLFGLVNGLFLALLFFNRRQKTMVRREQEWNDCEQPDGASRTT